MKRAEPVAQPVTFRRRRKKPVFVCCGARECEAGGDTREVGSGGDHEVGRRRTFVLATRLRASLSSQWSTGKARPGKEAARRWKFADEANRNQRSSHHLRLYALQQLFFVLWGT